MTEPKETGLLEQRTNPTNWIYIAQMYYGIDPGGGGGHIIGIKLVVDFIKWLWCCVIVVVVNET